MSPRYLWLLFGAFVAIGCLSRRVQPALAGEPKWWYTPTPTPCMETPTPTPCMETPTPTPMCEYTLCGDYTEKCEQEKCEKYGCQWLSSDTQGLKEEWRKYSGVCVVIKSKQPQCQNIPYEKRIDCGYDGILPEQCYARGCCWEGGLDKYNWCYFPRVCETVCAKYVTVDSEVCIEWAKDKYGKKKCVKFKPETKCIQHKQVCRDGLAKN